MISACASDIETATASKGGPTPGAYDLQTYLPILEGKSVGIVVNQTSFIGDQHLVDTLLDYGLDIKAIFAPEHGFRGEASAGAKVDDDIDPDTGIKILSIYGKNKKPSPAQLMGIDIMVFDIQDVGARFYTYISTLEYVMTACAEASIPIIILDRPNPNGNYVDGPILDLEYRSFVGRQAIPIVHGMTVGEYAMMLNGEKWLADGIVCDPADLTVVKCRNYTHDSEYILPIPPSPNLPNQRSIYLYPSLCLLEGTTASLGRGTEKQFQVILHPDYPDTSYSDTPIKRPGAKWPKHEDKVSYGLDLSSQNLGEFNRPNQLNLRYLIDFYKAMGSDPSFILENKFIDKLAGSDQLRKDIISGKSAEEIRAGWREGLVSFKIKRKEYLLYP